MKGSSAASSMHPSGHWQSLPLAQLVSSAAPAAEQPLSGNPVVPPLVPLPVVPAVPELEVPLVPLDADDPLEPEVEPAVEVAVDEVVEPVVVPPVVKGALPWLQPSARSSALPMNGEDLSVSIHVSSGEV
jgi:hypothetical protein